MTTININVPGITVVVNGDNIDINPTTPSQHTAQANMPYPGQPTYQPFNFNPEQPRYLNPRFFNSDSRVSSSNPGFTEKESPFKTMVENYNNNSNDKFMTPEYDYSSYNGPTFNSDQLFKMLRELPESSIYISELISERRPTQTQVTTQTVKIETIQFSEHNTCLTVLIKRDDKKIEYTWCKAGMNTWVSKEKYIELKDMQLNKNY